MPYLSFDLDGKKRAALAARALGVGPGVIAWGLLELWEYAWGAKCDVVGELVLDGCFGPDERIRAALVVYGFLEVAGAAWRVRGASKYLKIAKAQSDAGKARSAGARDGKGRLAPAPVQLLPSSPPAPDQPLHPAPSTQHPTPEAKDISAAELLDQEVPLLTMQEATSTSLVEKIVGHFCEAMAANGIEVRPTESKRKLVRARLKDGFDEDTIVRAINGFTFSDWHMGRDPKTGGRRYAELKYCLESAEKVESYSQRAPSAELRRFL